ncbi:MAG: putative Bug-like extra-cytoplasmic solute receptor, TTT-family [Betaproteobacteria bacterium]|nr:putative Bug-like extra-cytoplasmic solute receptor, TTT-family [Betaproteobacteria bacterium]
MRAISTLFVALSLQLLSIGTAGAYPERPVRFIVPSAPGDGPDVTSRVIAAQLSRQLGKQFVIDNRPGGNSSIGTGMIATAPPDGYTIGQGNFATLATNRSMMKLPYDPDRDLQMIGQYSFVANILAVAPALPVKSVQELIDYARKNPGKLQFASAGNGSSMHLSGELFKRMTAIDMLHVPYKAAQQGIVDLMGGQIHVMFDNMSSIGVHVRAAKVRGLAVTSLTRSVSYPELPTMSEAGVPQFEVVPFGGLVAPAAVPRAVIDLLNTELNKALSSPTVQERFAVLGSVPTGGTPEQFAAVVRKEAHKWATVIKDAHIKAD